jgi:hypothetical protein
MIRVALSREGARKTANDINTLEFGVRHRIEA